jgi:hypothetical protein
MMNPFLLPPRERLADWKALRASLAALPEDEQLRKVATYWAQAPVANFAYDPEHPETWPTAWEMIAEGDWCRASVAVGMEFTLRLSGWPAERLKLVQIKDYDISDLLFVVEVDGRSYLNYEHGVVSDIPDTRREVICAWQFATRGYKAV